MKMDEKILEVTGEFIERYGLKKFTMDEIARTLGISKKTLYQHFDSKQALITAYFEKVYTEDFAITEAILADETKDLSEKLYQVVASYEKHHITMQVSEEAEKHFPKQWEQLEKIRKTKVDALTLLFTKAASDDKIRAPHKKEMIVMIVDQWSQLIMKRQFLKKYGDYSTREVAIAFVDMILNGCLQS